MKRRNPSTPMNTHSSSLGTSDSILSSPLSSSSSAAVSMATGVRGGSTASSHTRPRRHHHDRSAGARISRFVALAKENTVQKVQVQIRTIFNNSNSHNANPASTAQYGVPSGSSMEVLPAEEVHKNDRWNYALLILLYTLQGIPMGLSASIPFLLQEKITKMAAASVVAGGGGAAAVVGGKAVAASVAATAAASKASYNANAIFALCSWPFSLKLLWAPIVDALYFQKFGRRKSWLVPVQTLAGLIMVGGANFVERQLGLSTDGSGDSSTMNVQGVTSFFFLLYFLMATQDIAVDGWALTMLSKANRGRGPICNSIGQNIGYFLSFVGFLALNDIEASETLWRPLLRLPSNPTEGLIRLRGFLRFMGFLMLATTLVVALFKRELAPTTTADAAVWPTDSGSDGVLLASTKMQEYNDIDDGDDDAELDASTIGLRETYHRLWAVCQLPAVRTLFLILVTYRLPVALSDNVKFLKAVEYGLSKSTTALLSPTLILPLGILVPIVAHKIWHMAPLQQFSTAYRFRVTLVPLMDLLMLHLLRSGYPHNSIWFWLAVIASTAGQAIVNSLQFNAQMIFFASRVDPAIGGSYMTLLNTAANLGGTWPSSFVMWLIGVLTPSAGGGGSDGGGGGRDPYNTLQLVFSAMGIAWLFYFGPKLRHLAALPGDAWRTHLLDDEKGDTRAGATTFTKTRLVGGPTSRAKQDQYGDLESGEASIRSWQIQQEQEQQQQQQDTEKDK